MGICEFILLFSGAIVLIAVLCIQRTCRVKNEHYNSVYRANKRRMAEKRFWAENRKTRFVGGEGFWAD